MKQPYVTAVIALAVLGCDRAEDMKSTYPASKFDLTHWSLTYRSMTIMTARLILSSRANCKLIFTRDIFISMKTVIWFSPAPMWRRPR